MVSKKVNKNYLNDSERTQKSCLDVVFELLATTAGTSSSNSLPESVRLLESQLQVERHRSNVLRQEAKGLKVPAEFRCILSSATTSAGGFKRPTRES